MDRLLSQMSPEELRRLMNEWKERARLLMAEGAYSEVMVLRTKYYLAQSYLMDPQSIHAGETYYVEGFPPQTTFTVTKIEGIMAHGVLSSSPLPQAFPIAMLTKEPARED